MAVTGVGRDKTSAESAGSAESAESAGSATSADDAHWLDMAIALAHRNVETGGRPFGAVVVLAGTLVATGVNEVLARNDPTAHAEILAIRQACAVLKTASLSDAILYASCEPCPMCLAATRWADLAEIVYGADTAAAAQAGFEDQELYDLFTRPRRDWPLSMRRLRMPHGAEGPLNEWRRRHRTD